MRSAAKANSWRLVCGCHTRCSVLCSVRHRRAVRGLSWSAGRRKAFLHIAYCWQSLHSSVQTCYCLKYFAFISKVNFNPVYVPKFWVCCTQTLCWYIVSVMWYWEVFLLLLRRLFTWDLYLLTYLLTLLTYLLTPWFCGPQTALASPVADSLLFCPLSFVAIFITFIYHRSFS